MATIASVTKREDGLYEGEHKTLVILPIVGEPLYLQRHRIQSGKQTIRITVPRAAVRAGIDPRHELIDRERDDNVVRVVAAAAARS